MIELEKVTEALDSEEGIELLAEYTKLYLQKHFPDKLNDENHQRFVMVALTQELCNSTVPNGMDSHYFIIKTLEACVEQMKSPTKTDINDGGPYTPPSTTYENNVGCFASIKKAYWIFLIACFIISAVYYLVTLLLK